MVEMSAVKWTNVLLIFRVWLCLAAKAKDGDTNCPVCLVTDEFHYGFFKDEMQYKDARQVCHLYGGRLLIPRNSDEQKNIEDIFVKYHMTSNVYLGMSNFLEDGTWLMEDYTRVEHEDSWKNGVPNSKDENCVFMNKDKKWEGTSCDRKSVFVCEMLNVGKLKVCPLKCGVAGQKGTFEGEEADWLTSRAKCLLRGADLYFADMPSATREIIEETLELRPHRYYVLNKPRRKVGGFGRRKRQDDDECGVIDKDGFKAESCKDGRKSMCASKKPQDILKEKNIPDIATLRTFRYPCVEYFGECIIFFNEPKTYDEAKKTCEERDSRLVDQDAKDMFLTLFLALTISKNETLSKEDSYFIGYKFNNGDDSKELKKKQKMLELFIRKKWDLDGDGEIKKDGQCFALRKEASYMVDTVDCDEKLPFICSGAT